MPDFWDLPRSVRDKIYRMHLVLPGPVTEAKHKSMCRMVRTYHTDPAKVIPVLLQISDRAAHEAAHIYYGENVFESQELDARVFTEHLRLKYVHLIRKVTIDWDPYAFSAGRKIKSLARLKGLQELNIRVNEYMMVHLGLVKRDTRQSYKEKSTYSSQEQLAIWHFPGLAGLLSLQGIPVVNFLPRINPANKAVGGTIPGGVLLTSVLPKLTAPAVKIQSKETAVDEEKMKEKEEEREKKTKTKKKKNTKKLQRKVKPTYFDFMNLAPEVRNVVYEMLLCVDGPIHPSKKKPSTEGKNIHEGGAQDNNSALCLLAVNKQIRDEAVGVYYATPFVFYYPTQFHAFVQDLGSLRRSVIKDVTIHYDNTKRGGINLVDLTFPLLRDLNKLRRLSIVMNGHLVNRILPRNHWGSTWKMEGANPGLMPGVHVLFSLRGLTEIKIRDQKLDEEHEQAQRDKAYPNFFAQSRSYHIVKLAAALEHLNKALLDAQEGRVNAELLQNNTWHTRDDFPQMLDEKDPVEEDQEQDREGRGMDEGDCSESVTSCDEDDEEETADEENEDDEEDTADEDDEDADEDGNDGDDDFDNDDPMV